MFFKQFTASTTDISAATITGQCVSSVSLTLSPCLSTKHRHASEDVSLGIHQFFTKTRASRAILIYIPYSA